MLGYWRPAHYGETVLSALDSGAPWSQARLQMRPHPCSSPVLLHPVTGYSPKCLQNKSLAHEPSSQALLWETRLNTASRPDDVAPRTIWAKQWVSKQRFKPVITDFWEDANSAHTTMQEEGLSKKNRYLVNTCQKSNGLYQVECFFSLRTAYFFFSMYVCVCLFVCNLYTQHEAGTHDPEIELHAPLHQPSAPRAGF